MRDSTRFSTPAQGIAFEQAIYNLLLVTGCQVEIRDLEHLHFADFLVRTPEGRRLAVEVKSRTRGVEPRTLRTLARGLERLQRRMDGFVLVTPEPPSPAHREAFRRACDSARVPSEWLGPDEFQRRLGIESPIDLSSPRIMSGLQGAAITAQFDKYLGLPKDVSRPIADLRAVLLLRPTVRRGRRARRLSVEAAVQHAADEAEKIPKQHLDLRRQFPIARIKTLTSGNQPIARRLKLNRVASDVVIVLSDIINFSTLVRAAHRDDLRDAMEGYYRNARALVWKNNGVLDKFIGDAVLAVFGYPSRSRSKVRDATRFAAQLVQLGCASLDRLRERTNEDIRTGTRVGVDVGDVTVLNIAHEGIEVAFIGNVVNLAARLEASCGPNGILMSNRAYAVTSEPFRRQLGRAGIKRRRLPKSKVKGQMADVLAWQIPARSVKWLADSS